MFLENKKLDKQVPIPLYFQLKELIREEIKSGDHAVDSLIPTEKELSEQFDISRTTVRQAVTELVQEGWLYRVKSKGTFIARQKLKQDFLQKLETFSQQMRRIGLEPSTEVLRFEVENATREVAENLQLEEGEQVLSLFRRRFGGGEPVVTVESYLPFSSCAFLKGRNFETESLYECMAEKKETRIFGARRLVEAVAANEEDSRYLNIRTGSPVQLIHTLGVNESGTPLEYSIARYRGDMSSFQLYVYVDS